MPPSLLDGVGYSLETAFQINHPTSPLPIIIKGLIQIGRKIKLPVSNFSAVGSCLFGGALKMGAGEAKASKPNSDTETQVVVNVYDLTSLNNYTYWFGFGIFHSGIEVHGKEYGYGAHDFPFSGVFEVEPRSCPGFTYRCSISLGCINLPLSEFRTLLENAASEYHGCSYHLITKNCNHFTDEMAWRLTGKHIPGWVNRLAHVGSVCSCLLPECLKEITVKQLPQFHESAEDENAPSSEDEGPCERTESDEADRDKLLPSS